MEIEGESAAKIVVQSESAKNKGDCEKEKLGEPENEDGFDGDVHGSLTAQVFDYVETMALNDIVYQDKLQLEQLRTLDGGQHTKGHENHGNEETHDDFKDHACFSIFCVVVGDLS